MCVCDLQGRSEGLVQRRIHGTRERGMVLRSARHRVDLAVEKLELDVAMHRKPDVLRVRVSVMPAPHEGWIRQNELCVIWGEKRPQPLRGPAEGAAHAPYSIDPFSLALSRDALVVLVCRCSRCLYKTKSGGLLSRCR
jgi:hypothetical protein